MSTPTIDEVALQAIEVAFYGELHALREMTYPLLYFHQDIADTDESTAEFGARYPEIIRDLARFLKGVRECADACKAIEARILAHPLAPCPQP